MSEPAEWKSDHPEEHAKITTGMPHAFWAPNLMQHQTTCCDGLDQDAVKLTAESLICLIDGRDRRWCRPTELGTWSHPSGTLINHVLCDNDILVRVQRGEDKYRHYFKFTCFTKAWAHFTAERLKTRPSGHNNKENK